MDQIVQNTPVDEPIFAEDGTLKKKPLSKQRALLIGGVALGVFLFVIAIVVSAQSSFVAHQTQESQISPTETVLPTEAMLPLHETTTAPSTQPTLAKTQTIKNTPTLTQRIPTNTSVPPTASPQPTAAPTSIPDTTPPVVDEFGGPANTTSPNFCFPVHITDNVSHLPDLYERTRFDGSNWSDWTNNDFANCYNNVAPGPHTFTFQAKDGAGNTTVEMERMFTVVQ